MKHKTISTKQTNFDSSRRAAASGTKRINLQLSPQDLLFQHHLKYGNRGVQQMHETGILQTSLLIRRSKSREGLARSGKYEITRMPANQIQCETLDDPEEETCTPGRKGPSVSQLNYYLGTAADKLKDAADFIYILERITNLLIKVASANEVENRAFFISHAALMQKIRKEGEVNLFDAVFNITVGIAEIASGIGGLYLAAKKIGKLAQSVAKVGASASIAKGGKRAIEGLLGAKDVTLLQELAEANAVTNRRIDRLGQNILEILVLFSEHVQIDIKSAMRTINRNIDSASKGLLDGTICGPDYPASMISNFSAQIDAGKKSTEQISVYINRVVALIESAQSIGPQKMREDRSERKLFNFLIERSKDGSLSQFKLLRHEHDLIFTKFGWKEQGPGGVWATFHAHRRNLSGYGKYDLKFPPKWKEEVMRVMFTHEERPDRLWLPYYHYKALRPLKRLGLTLEDVIYFIIGSYRTEVDMLTYRFFWSSKAMARLFKDKIVPIPPKYKGARLLGLYWVDKDFYYSIVDNSSGFGRNYYLK